MTRGVAILLVGTLTLVAHLRARDNPFVFFDDPRFVTLNPHIESTDDPARFFTDLSTVAAPGSTTQDIYRPLRTLSYAWIFDAGGLDPKLFHSVSVFLHALVAALLALLLLRAGIAPWGAAVGALAFGIHPRTVEVTAWVCSLGDILCGLFMVLSMLCYASSRRVPGAIGAVLCFVVALFSKEHALVLPGLWVAWDLWVRKERPTTPAIAWRAVAPGLVVIVAFLWWRDHVGTEFQQLSEPLRGTALSRIKTMLSGMGWYGATTLWPHPPTFQARVSPDASWVSLSVLSGIAVTAGLFAWWRWGERRERAGVAWFLLALIPVSNVIAPLKVPTADRFLYFSLMGLALAFGALVARRGWRASSVGVLAVLSLLTVHRIDDWSSDTSLIAAGKRVHPRSIMLLWAEAAEKAQRSQKLFVAGDGVRAMEIGAEAETLYANFFRNAELPDELKARIEVADLQYETGKWLQIYDPQERWRIAISRAMENYNFARQMQQNKVGRVVEAQEIWVAHRVVELAVMLAEPRNKNFGQTVAAGMSALSFLNDKGFDTNLSFAKLRFAEASHPSIRVGKPERAREIFNNVEQRLRKEEARGQSVQFMLAQTYYFRSILKDQPYDRKGLDQAIKLYDQAAVENRTWRRSHLNKGRTLRTIGQLFDDLASAQGAVRFLEYMLNTDAKKHPRLYPKSLIEDIKGELQLAQAQVGRLTPQ